MSTAAGMPASMDPIVRPPRDEERAACRMLLPEAYRGGANSGFLLAAGENPPRIFAALGFQPKHHYGRPAWQFSLRVARPYRRQGIGRRLLRTLEAQAVQLGQTALLAAVDDSSGPESLPFLHTLQFVPDHAFTTFEAPLTDLSAKVFPLRDRLLARGKIPANARFVHLGEAPLDQVALFHAQNLGGVPLGHVLQLEHYLQQPELVAPSVVLLVDGQVQGMVLVVMEGDIARVDARIVAPAYRRNWANTMLMAYGLEWGAAVGCKGIRLESSSDNLDTLSLAVKSAASVVRTVQVHKRSLPAPRPI